MRKDRDTPTIRTAHIDQGNIVVLRLTSSSIPTATSSSSSSSSKKMGCWAFRKRNSPGSRPIYVITRDVLSLTGLVPCCGGVRKQWIGHKPIQSRTSCAACDRPMSICRMTRIQQYRIDLRTPCNVVIYQGPQQRPTVPGGVCFGPRFELFMDI